MADSEPQGFREYVAARRQGLLAVGYVLTGSQHGAEDLVQATLVKVWPRWNRVAEAGDPDAYVRKAMLNTFLSWRRRDGGREIPSDDVASLPLSAPRPSADSGAGNALTGVLDRVVLRDLLRALPRRQRAVVVLRYYADLTEAQVAEAMGCSVGTVKSQHAKALATLRRHTPAEDR
ncbi:SigE family RNA polymerase sigma factor [Catenulispora rubra]|uniref:SigE family RNA polymerase sigma factor n=1 Tax=Catenulispora rubra TaxID=280293 RepID=UPI0018926EBC|nr:SigE family RNA polymerase sigma factor [Catenulispora rubra]